MRRHSTNIPKKSGPLSVYPRNKTGYSKPALYFLGGILLIIGTFWVGGCSSNSKPTSDPTKQEVQTDSDRFFKKLEKEEAKKEATEEKP